MESPTVKSESAKGCFFQTSYKESGFLDMFDIIRRHFILNRKFKRESDCLTFGSLTSFVARTYTSSRLATKSYKFLQLSKDTRISA